MSSSKHGTNACTCNTVGTKEHGKGRLERLVWHNAVLKRNAFNRRQQNRKNVLLSKKRFYQCVQYFRVSKQWYGCQSLRLITRAQMLMHMIVRTPWEIQSHWKLTLGKNLLPNPGLEPAKVLIYKMEIKLTEHFETKSSIWSFCCDRFYLLKKAGLPGQNIFLEG